MKNRRFFGFLVMAIFATSCVVVYRTPEENIAYWGGEAGLSLSARDSIASLIKSPTLTRGYFVGLAERRINRKLPSLYVWRQGYVDYAAYYYLGRTGLPVTKLDTLISKGIGWQEARRQLYILAGGKTGKR
jgi:hypothetical protein